jgi:hypothetical protein
MHIKLLSASCNFRQSKVNALNNNFAASKSRGLCVNRGRVEGICVCEHITFSSPRSLSLSHTSQSAQRKVFIKYLHRVHSARARLRAASQRKEETPLLREGASRFQYTFYSRTTLNSNGIFMILHIVVLI